MIIKDDMTVLEEKKKQRDQRLGMYKGGTMFRQVLGIDISMKEIYQGSTPSNSLFEEKDKPVLFDDECPYRDHSICKAAISTLQIDENRIIKYCTADYDDCSAFLTRSLMMLTSGKKDI